MISPEVELRAVETVFGNVTLEQTTDNALRILALIGPAPPGPDEEMPAYARRIELLVRSHHPEVSDGAIRAIGTLYAYGWK